MREREGGRERNGGRGDREVYVECVYVKKLERKTMTILQVKLFF